MRYVTALHFSRGAREMKEDPFHRERERARRLAQLCRIDGPMDKTELLKVCPPETEGGDGGGGGSGGGGDGEQGEGGPNNKPAVRATWPGGWPWQPAVVDEGWPRRPGSGTPPRDYISSFAPSPPRGGGAVRPASSPAGGRQSQRQQREPHPDIIRHDDVLLPRWAVAPGKPLATPSWPAQRPASARTQPASPSPAAGGGGGRGGVEARARTFSYRPPDTAGPPEPVPATVWAEAAEAQARDTAALRQEVQRLRGDMETRHASLVQLVTEGLGQLRRELTEQMRAAVEQRAKQLSRSVDERLQTSYTRVRLVRFPTALLRALALISLHPGITRRRGVRSP
eukprot:COSAG01_NODE_5028_length_4537_cov_4.829428_6_plen_340_part_00